MVHGRAGMPALIGEEASIAHNAVIHGATIGARALIANGAQVLDGAVVGEGALVAAGSVVLPETVIPAGMLAAGTPAQVKRSIAGTPSQEWVENNPGRYARLAAEHLAGLREITHDSSTIGGHDSA